MREKLTVMCGLVPVKKGLAVRLLWCREGAETRTKQVHVRLRGGKVSKRFRHSWVQREKKKRQPRVSMKSSKREELNCRITPRFSSWKWEKSIPKIVVVVVPNLCPRGGGKSKGGAACFSLRKDQPENRKTHRFHSTISASKSATQKRGGGKAKSPWGEGGGITTVSVIGGMVVKLKVGGRD